MTTTYTRISSAFWGLGSLTHNLIASDALIAHARNRLAITAETEVRPRIGTLTSLVSLAIGAGFPVVGSPRDVDDSPGYRCTLICGALLGACRIVSRQGTCSPTVIREPAWGALAMAAA